MNPVFEFSIYFHIRIVYYNIITQIRQTSKQFRQRSGEIWSESPLQSHPHTLKYCGFAVLRMKLVVRNRIDHTIFYQRYWGKEVGVPHNNFSCENQQQQLTSLQIDTYKIPILALFLTYQLIFIVAAQGMKNKGLEALNNIYEYVHEDREKVRIQIFNLNVNFFLSFHEQLHTPPPWKEPTTL